MTKPKLQAIVKVFTLLVTICFLMSSCKSGTKEDSIVEYPANYLIMENEPIDYEKLPKPVELYSHSGPNGVERLLDYEIVEVVLLEYGGESHIIETDFKDKKFVTSEGIHVGSQKKEVLSSYKKYGIQEFSSDKLTDYNVRSSIVTLSEFQVTTPFLYVSNEKVFQQSYTGKDYWGGLGALIFIFNDKNEVSRIVRVAPTSG
jgi:hypothetical protein